MVTNPDIGSRSLSRRDVLRAGGIATAAGVVGAAAVGTGGSTPSTHTLITQNAWLLDEAWAGLVENQPDAADGDWIPMAERHKPIQKPDLEDRAQELGARLSYSDLDVVALQEVFDAEQRAQIRAPIQRELDDAVGPRQRPEKLAVSSGLYTLGLGRPIHLTETMAFENRGSRRRDSDAYAQKGVLFTRVGLGEGAMDLFTTHLLAGGGWPGEAVDPSPAVETPSPAEYRRRQLGEFEAFVTAVKDEHDPDGEVPIVCAGDFNIAPGDPADPALQTFQDNLGLVDAWEQTHPNGAGPTDTTAITDGCAFDPWESPPAYCDGGSDPDAERIDYVFVEDRPDLRVASVRRRVFWRERASPTEFFADDEQTVPNYLADHVGLEVEFGLGGG